MISVGDIVSKQIPDSFDGKKWHYKTISGLIVMAVVEKKYLMVRRKNCYPSILSIEDATLDVKKGTA